MAARKAFELGGVSIAAGTRQTIDLPIADLYTHTRLHMPVRVVHGKRDGPTLFVSAAVHGDEINGVEVIRRLLVSKRLVGLKGTLITVPIVNVQGFLAHTRYTPDRRDVNRSFPGSENGSVAGRLAWRFATEIVARADCGIDLHTAAVHRDNLPQIRADLDDPKTRKLAEAFGAPVMIPSALRDGSLREYAASTGVPMLLYEAGEALRFDEQCIRAGVRGVLNVMRTLGMLTPSKKASRASSAVARGSTWVRAERSGILRTQVGLGERVRKGQQLALVSDPFGESEAPIEAKFGGVVIGRTNLPLVNEGDAVFHIARFADVREAAETVEQFSDETSEWELPEQGPSII